MFNFYRTTAVLGEVIGLPVCLKCELSYCDFCVEIPKFSLPWQQGLGLAQISLIHLNRQTPKTPYLAQESR